MFAIIKVDGKQKRVVQGDVIRLDRMNAKLGEAFRNDQVLAIGGSKELEIGSPIIPGANVQCTVLKHGKDKKVIVFKRKRRKTYRRKYGHRQAHTIVKIDKISAKGVSLDKEILEEKLIPTKKVDEPKKPTQVKKTGVSKKSVSEKKPTQVKKTGVSTKSISEKKSTPAKKKIKKI